MPDVVNRKADNRYQSIVINIIELFRIKPYSRNISSVDCLQSVFSLKIRLVLLAASPLASLGFPCSNFAKKNKRLLAVQVKSLANPKSVPAI